MQADVTAGDIAERIKVGGQMRQAGWRWQYSAARSTAEGCMLYDWLAPDGTVYPNTAREPGNLPPPAAVAAWRATGAVGA